MVWVMMKQTLVINVEVDVGSSSLGKTLRRSFREKPCAFVLKLKILAKLKENTRKIEGKYWQIWWLIQVVLSKCIKFSHHFPHETIWTYCIWGVPTGTKFSEKPSKSRAKSQGTQRSSQSRWVASWMTMTTPPLARNLLGSPRRRPPCKTANTITEHCKAATL